MLQITLIKQLRSQHLHTYQSRRGPFFAYNTLIGVWVGADIDVILGWSLVRTWYDNFHNCDDFSFKGAGFLISRGLYLSNFTSSGEFGTTNTLIRRPLPITNRKASYGFAMIAPNSVWGALTCKCATVTKFPNDPTLLAHNFWSIRNFFNLIGLHNNYSISSIRI
jgi:hypothetical protein